MIEQMTPLRRRMIDDMAIRNMHLLLSVRHRRRHRLFRLR
jgi:hypothetical protein